MQSPKVGIGVEADASDGCCSAAQMQLANYIE